MDESTGEGGAGVGNTLIKSAASAKRQKQRSDVEASLSDLAQNVVGVARPYVSDNKGAPLPKQLLKSKPDDEARPRFVTHNRYRQSDKRDKNGWTVVHHPNRVVGRNKPVPLGKDIVGEGRTIDPNPTKYINNRHHQELDPRTGCTEIASLISGRPGPVAQDTRDPSVTRRRRFHAADDEGRLSLSHDDSWVQYQPPSLRLTGRPSVRPSGPTYRNRWETGTQNSAFTTQPQQHTPSHRPASRQSEQAKWATKTCPHPGVGKTTDFNRFVGHESLRSPGGLRNSLLEGTC